MSSELMHAMSPTAKSSLGSHGSYQPRLKAPYPEFPLPPPTVPMGQFQDGYGPVSEAPSSAEFSAMLVAFRATGGTARGDDLARLLQDRSNKDHVSLARLIATHKVLSFGWHNTYWVPMFQFDLGDLSIRPGPQQVMAELSAGVANWRIAMWFAKVNAWLNGDRPVDALGTDVKAVIEAARSDRLVAAG